jgi:hypothetical protein
MESNPGLHGKMLGTNSFNNGTGIRTDPYQYREHSTVLQHIHFR